jgi:hypothetical protein
VVQRAANAVRLRVRAARRGRPGTSGETAAQGRKLTPPELAAVARFRDVVAEGLPRTVYDRVEREGVMPELLRADPGAVREPDQPWPAIGGSLVIGIIRFSGLLPGGAPGRLVPPPRAGIETIEIARIPTVAVALVVIRRLVSVVTHRVAAAISTRRQAGTSR